MLCVALADGALDPQVKEVVRELDAGAWDKAASRNAPAAQCAGAVAEVLRRKAKRSLRVFEAVRNLALDADRRMEEGVRDTTERGEVLEWLRGVGLRDAQVVRDGLEGMRISGWSGGMQTCIVSDS